MVTANCIFSIVITVLIIFASTNEAVEVLASFGFISVFYFVTYGVSIACTSALSLGSLFLFSLGFFGLFGIAMTVFGLGDITQFGTLGISYNWSESASRVVVQCYGLLLFAYNLCLFYRQVISKKVSKKSKTPNIPITERILLSKKAMQFLFVPAAIFLAFASIQVLYSGYLSLYIGAARGILYRLGSLSYFLFTASFMFFISSRPELDDFSKYGRRFLFLSFLNSTQGVRSAFLAPLLFYFWYGKYRFNRRINPVLALIICLFGIPVLGAIAYIRNNVTVGLDYGGLFTETVMASSSSISVLALVYDYGLLSINDSYPFILDPIVRLCLVVLHPDVFSLGNSIELNLVSNNLPNQLSYALAPEQYLLGGGLGGNFIAELYEFGVVGIVLGIVFLVVIIGWFERIADVSVLASYFAYPFIRHLLLMPRAEYFLDTYTIAKFLVVYALFWFLVAAYKVSAQKKGSASA